MELDHLSYSSISTFELCARSWRFKYLDKVASPPTPALVFGSAFHATIEDIYRSYDPYGGSECDPLVVWREHWSRLSANPEIRWDAESPEMIGADGIKLFGSVAVLDEISRHRPLQTPLHSPDEPFCIERKIELRVPGVPVPIIGYIDMIESDGVPCDFKTSSRAWTDAKHDAETQPLFYLAALNQSGYYCPELKFRHFVFIKTGKPRVQVLESTHTLSELLWLFESIQAVWKAIEAEAFTMNPTAWICTERWCPYWFSCRGRK